MNGTKVSFSIVSQKIHEFPCCSRLSSHGSETWHSHTNPHPPVMFEHSQRCPDLREEAVGRPAQPASPSPRPRTPSSSGTASVSSASAAKQRAPAHRSRTGSDALPSSRGAPHHLRRTRPLGTSDVAIDGSSLRTSPFKSPVLEQTSVPLPFSGASNSNLRLVVCPLEAKARASRPQGHSEA